MSRIPDIDYLVAALILTYKIKRPYEFKSEMRQGYTCPACHRKFGLSMIQCPKRRKYLRNSAQPKRHYDSLTCIRKSLLIREGYLRNDSTEVRAKAKFYRNTPLLSNAVQYILGLGKFSLQEVQLLSYGMLHDKVILRPFVNYYNYDVRNLRRIPFNTLVSNEKKRAVKIPHCDVTKESSLMFPNIRVSLFKTQMEVKDFVCNRLKLLKQYFRTPEDMIYMPSFNNSETKRKISDNLTSGMQRYLDTIECTTSPTKKRRIGLLSD